MRHKFCNDYNRKLPNFALYEGRKQKTMMFFSFTGLASEETLNICLIWQDGIRAMKLGTAECKKGQFYKLQLQLYKQVVLQAVASIY